MPKAAGTSVAKQFNEWFGDRILPHYYDEAMGALPQRYELFEHDLSGDNGHVIYGHFNRARGFGVADYYPQANQFITILRDPFERVISAYFFLKKNGLEWQDQPVLPKHDLRQYLLGESSSMLNHFPIPLTFQNYKEIIEKYFIEIGVFEYLDESMSRIATSLGFVYTEGSLPMLNSGDKTEEVPTELRDQFLEKRELEFAVYSYALKKYLT